MPRLLDDILESVFSGDESVTVLHALARSASVADAAGATQPDVLIVDERAAGPRDVDEVLRLAPHAQALAIAEDARTAVLYELRPRRHLIGELSPAAVRSAVHHARRRSDPFFEPRPAP